ncbi:MAG: hypothetical protein ACJASL_000626 [Paraglaciecola sp.]|jgi:hypothetical protein
MFNEIRSTTVVVSLLFAVLGVTPISAEEANVFAETKAQTDIDIQIAVANASKAWKDTFNSGDAAGAAALYEEDAVMFVKPFGIFTGKDEILAFWTDLISKGFDDVVYSDTTTVILDEQSARVSADWKMNNAHGVITNEVWVIQADGRALLREDHFEVEQ